MDKARILIVEDERIVAEDIQISLAKLGYSVAGIAASGEEAVEKAEELCPDLVLMDIKLKGDMDGVEAAEQIRARFAIPVRPFLRRMSTALASSPPASVRAFLHSIMG